MVGGGIRALACVPLRDGGSAIGALYLDSRRASARITELDAELLVEFVERMALAIAVRTPYSMTSSPLATSWRATLCPSGISASTSTVTEAAPSSRSRSAEQMRSNVPNRFDETTRHC